MQFYDGWFDVGYGLVIVGLIISLWASWNVKSTFRRYQNDRNSRGLTARHRWHGRFWMTTVCIRFALNRSPAI